MPSTEQESTAAIPRVRRGVALVATLQRVHRPLLVTVTATAVAWVLLVWSVTLALALPALGHPDGYPEARRLAYSTQTGARFTGLSDRFLAQALGRPLSEATFGAAPAGAARPAPTTARPRVRAEHDFSNDAFAAAFPVESVPFTATTTTTGATREPGEPAACSAVGGSAWYRYTASEEQAILANTFGSRYAVALGAFEGESMADLRNLDCDSGAAGNAQVGLTVRPGTTYYFQVVGPAGGGRLVFNLDRIGSTNRVSLSRTGHQRSGDSVAGGPTNGMRPISGDGRYTVFVSYGAADESARDPRPECLANYCAVFVHDHRTGRSTLVSVTPSGQPSRGTFWSPSISDDGRYVAFTSDASDLVADDPNDGHDHFVRDLLTGRTEQVSVDLPGQRHAYSDANPTDVTMLSMSADGRYVAFAQYMDEPDPPPPDRPNVVPFARLFVRDRLTRTTALVHTQHPVSNPSISADGRFVAYELLGPTGQVQVHDRVSGTAVVASVAPDGSPGDDLSRKPALSADGRYVAFSSVASNLVPGDTNQLEDVFVRDLVERRTVRVSVDSEGRQGAVGDEPTPTAGWSVSISGDGRFVVFDSTAIGLVPDDTNGQADVFLRDLVQGVTVRASVTSYGEQRAEYSTDAAISRDGRLVGFGSYGAFVDDDTNGVYDVFVHENELAG